MVPVLVVAAAILMLLGFLALSNRGDGAGTANGSSSGSGAKASPLTTEMRDVAVHVDDPAHDGPAGPQAASRLRAIADKLDRGQSAGGDATALAADVRGWHDARQLGNTATDVTLRVLAKVPGVDMNAATPTTAAAGPGAGVQVRVGKGHKKHDD
jgi:hypothetical protein